MAWIRDVEHNPDPLSVPQAELVNLVNGAGLAALRVEDGLLYYDDNITGEVVDLPSLDYVAAGIATWQAHFADGAPTDIEDAMFTYLDFYRFYVQRIRPTLKRALAAVSHLDEALRSRLLDGAAEYSVARDQLLWELGRARNDEDEAAAAALLANYITKFGASSTVWDVAAPNDAERPQHIQWMAALWAASTAPIERRAAAQADATAALATLDADARAAVLAARRAIALSDEDDSIFFAAQQWMRHALLERGRTFVAAGRLDAVEDVFDLPLQPAFGFPADPRIYVVAQRERRAQRRATPTATSATFSARGGAGHAEGRAVVVRSLHDMPTHALRDAILILPTFLPTHSYCLAVIRGLVVQTGGVLSHGAILAREYGVPYLVGVANALTISDGDDVVIDGSALRLLVRR